MFLLIQHSMRLYGSCLGWMTWRAEHERCPHFHFLWSHSDEKSAISTRIAPFVCTEENSYLLTGQRLTNGAGTADVYSSPMSLRLRSAEMIIFFGKFERLSALEYSMFKFLRIDVRRETHTVTLAISFSPVFLFGCCCLCCCCCCCCCCLFLSCWCINLELLLTGMALKLWNNSLHKVFVFWKSRKLFLHCPLSPWLSFRCFHRSVCALWVLISASASLPCDVPFSV